ncbi:hypothetical protein [Paenibacillus hexagrammi]|uniref:Methyl-accepting chemotaxis protein n=1 Tax=Paenibacillus hexagrammi TaxID=2908839 RepID=A0ABY3SND5_9BACL|nr:hypothetical protein [Paenibacillus sp. YPD9-1]UJF34993.1 hypothetical protein L0M14_07590 [Paenibacillus sp. YPD9-1]
MRYWLANKFIEMKAWRIKTKLFLLISVSMLLTSTISLAGLQIAYSIYDEQIYQKSGQVLNLSSTLIENELSKVDKITFNVMADTQIQQDRQ